MHCSQRFPNLLASRVGKLDNYRNYLLVGNFYIKFKWLRKNELRGLRFSWFGSC